MHSCNVGTIGSLLISWMSSLIEDHSVLVLWLFHHSWSRSKRFLILIYKSFCLTLHFSEVKYIWTMRLSWGKILFLLNRYFPFSLVPLFLHGGMPKYLYLILRHWQVQLSTIRFFPWVESWCEINLRFVSIMTSELMEWLALPEGSNHTRKCVARHYATYCILWYENLQWSYALLMPSLLVCFVACSYLWSIWYSSCSSHPTAACVYRMGKTRLSWLLSIIYVLRTFTFL